MDLYDYQEMKWLLATSYEVASARLQKNWEVKWLLKIVTSIVLPVLPDH
jgi:hypothetical protein